VDLKGVTLVYGRPGTGKTTLAAHIAAERLRRGEKVLWVSFYEDRDLLLKNAAALGYDLNKAHIWDAVLAKAEDVFNYIIALTTEEGAFPPRAGLHKPTAGPRREGPSDKRHV